MIMSNLIFVKIFQKIYLFKKIKNNRKSTKNVINYFLELYDNHRGLNITRNYIAGLFLKVRAWG
jgi:hypothetical protein